MSAPSRTGPAGKGGTALREAQVDYRLARNAVVRDVQRGRIVRSDVCDAHPELLRAARNIGRPTSQACPLCEQGRIVEVTFVFGARLPPGGTCPSTPSELKRLCRRADPVTCFAVEVCPACAWHHLARRYAAGGRPSRAGRNLR